MPESLRRQLGYVFRQPDLLRQALTHRSYGTPHNERLEFVGDAVLNCVVGVTLFERVQSSDASGLVGLPLIRLSESLRALGFLVP